MKPKFKNMIYIGLSSDGNRYKTFLVVLENNELWVALQPGDNSNIRLRDKIIIENKFGEPA